MDSLLASDSVILALRGTPYVRRDDLFSPFNRRRGLLVGNLTSQFFANLYLDGHNPFATELLRAPYVRYVDDFAVTR